MTIAGRAVIDAHVHLFPDRVFEALWRWFAEHAWEVRYQPDSDRIVAFLTTHGVDHLVALHYAHKPGMAESLNRYMLDIVRRHSCVTGLATVHPDDVAPGILVAKALDGGLAGVKLHCHVQAVAPNDPRLFPVYETCQERDAPVVIHAGREPSSPAYPCATHQVCSVHRIARVLEQFPGLRLCVPHLGADEEKEYVELLERFDELWLDTAMMAGDSFGGMAQGLALRVRPERVMYGTDFPNLPYPWDSELQVLLDSGLDEETSCLVLAENARRFFRIP